MDKLNLSELSKKSQSSVTNFTVKVDGKEREFIIKTSQDAELGLSDIKITEILADKSQAVKRTSALFRKLVKYVKN